MSQRTGIMYNASGNYDPTAGFALKHVMKADNYPVKWRGQPVYICPSKPIKTEEDFYRIDQYCRFAIKKGALPIAPLLFYADLYDLSEEDMQKQLLKWTRNWVKIASEIWVFDGETPSQLWDTFDKSLDFGKVIRYFGENDKGKLVQTREIREHSQLWKERDDNADTAQTQQG